MPQLRYFAVNVPALDPRRSKVKYYSGTKVISRIPRFVLRPIPGDAPPIFHVAEIPLLILVHDDLRRRLVAAGDHPGWFRLPEKYTL